MKCKKILRLLLGLTLCLSLVSTSHAAGVTFDLKLSNLIAIGVTALDVEDIESAAFFGTATLLTFPQTSTTGTFTEDGIAELKFYDNGTGTYEPFFTNGAELQVVFENLTGTYDMGSGSTEIEFDMTPVQTLTLKYFDLGSSIDEDLAVFSIGAGSGGVVVNELGAPQIQTYFLSLTTDTYGLFTGSAFNYEASLTASNFVGSMYVMSGEMSAVPVPSSLLLIGSGLVALLGFRRKEQ